MSASYTQDKMNVREVMNTITCGEGLGGSTITASGDNEWDGGNSATVYSAVDIVIESGDST